MKCYPFLTRGILSCLHSTTTTVTLLFFPLLGQVLPYENIRDIIKFCKEEKLVLLADEVGIPSKSIFKLFFLFNGIALTYKKLNYFFLRCTKQIFMEKE